MTAFTSDTSETHRLMTLHGDLAVTQHQKHLNDLLREGKITAEELAAFVERRNPFPTEIDWHRVYCLMGLQREYEAFANYHKFDLANVLKVWRVPVLQNVTGPMLILALKHLGVNFFCSPAKDVIAALEHKRSPVKKSYIASFRKCVEPEDEIGSVSDVTFIEALLLDIGYFMTTFQHLSADHWTLCTGSMHTGLAPGILWIEGGGRRELNITLHNVSEAANNPGFRTRRVIDY